MKESSILQNEINKALQAVTTTKHKTQILHSQWKNHLLRMSYLVLLLAMHQWSTPVQSCIQDLKSFQLYTDNNNDNYDYYEKMVFMNVILGDSMVEILNFIIAILLFQFLRVTTDNHSNTSTSTTTSTSFTKNKYYGLASTMILICLGMFFHNQKHYNHNSNSNSGCLMDYAIWTNNESLLQSISLSSSSSTTSSSTSSTTSTTSKVKTHQFPIACIFHIIVSGCYFFMKMNMDQCEVNVEAVKKLQEQLLVVKSSKEKKETTKAKNDDVNEKKKKKEKKEKKRKSKYTKNNKDNISSSNKKID